MYLLIVNSAGYNPPENSDNLAKAKKSSTFAAKSSRLWDDTVNLMPHLRKSDNRCPSRKRVIKLISDQVWSTDISYVSLEHGFMYLYAMIDVYSRYVLGWRLSPCKDVPNGCINRKKCLFNCRILGRGINIVYSVHKEEGVICILLEKRDSTYRWHDFCTIIMSVYV